MKFKYLANIMPCSAKVIDELHHVYIETNEAKRPWAEGDVVRLRRFGINVIIFSAHPDLIVYRHNFLTEFVFRVRAAYRLIRGKPLTSGVQAQGMRITAYPVAVAWERPNTSGTKTEKRANTFLR